MTSESSEPEGVVSAARFRRHLRYLKRHFRLVALSEATALLSDPGGLSEDVAVITLDDGYAGNYVSAWPVLREEQVPATIFVTTGFLDGSELWFDVAAKCLDVARRRPESLPARVQSELRTTLGRWPFRGSTTNAVERLKQVAPAVRERLVLTLREACGPIASPARALRWAQVREMVSAGIEIGAHTVSHPILSMLPADGQEREILGARDRIAEQTGVRPTLFAYPNGADGDFDERTVGILRRAGFTAACTTHRGSNHPGCDLFRLNRIGVGAEPSFVLAARLSGIFDGRVRRVLPGRTPRPIAASPASTGRAEPTTAQGGGSYREC